MKLTTRLPCGDRRVPFRIWPRFICPSHTGRRKVFGVWYHRRANLVFRWMGVDVRFSLPSRKRLARIFLLYNPPK